MERFCVSAALVYLFPSLLSPPPQLPLGNFCLGDSSPDLGMTLSCCSSFVSLLFFFFKEGWPTGNAFGASPKPFLTPHRLASTLTANKTALFFSISKLGVLFFLNFLEMSWNLLFRLPAYFPLWVHTPIFCLFSKLGHTDSFPETFAPGQRLWLATALFH